MKEKIKELLNGRIYLDGGTGSALLERGISSLHGETLNIEKPEIIKEIHKSYFEAGSNVIFTNTFGCNRKKADLSKYTLGELIRAATDNAKAVAAQYGGYVFYDCGPIGELLYPYGKLTFDEAYGIFSEQAEIVAGCGVDGVVIETISDLQEMRAAILAFKEKTDVPVICSMTFEKNGRTFAGTSIEGYALTVQALGVDAMGINCGTGAEDMKENLKKLCEYAYIPVYAKPNAGLPRYENGKTVYDTTEEEFALQMKEIAELGIGILGGCCGTNANHIRLTTEKTKDIAVKRFNNRVDAVCSYSRVKKFGESTLIIGERVNPTNKPLLKKAILEDNFDYILSMCAEQSSEGTDMLDINLGLPGTDEKEKLSSAIEYIQGVADLPLVIDTSDKDALERAVRVTNGVCVINSVNGEKEVMEKVFPIAKKYGSYVIALCLDNNGIPDTAEGRIRIAERIVETGKNYGISKEKLIFDPLTMAVSVDTSNAVITYEAMKTIKNKLNGKVTLGLSNVSFGLPNRAKINAAFLKKVIDAGADTVIINPVIKPKKDVFADKLLEGKDAQCAEYIAANTVKEEAPQAVKRTDIQYFITHGLTEEGLNAVKEQANENNYSDIIEKEIIGGLNTLGELYEQGKAFLPMLIAGSETAKAMLGYLQTKYMSGNGIKARATILMATVKGDVHDIGKNIVKAVVSNYGFRIIDLGKDVSTEEIFRAIDKYAPQAIGLSALMTTTVVNMTESVNAIKKIYPDMPVFVGGAVVTESYAEKIGAIYSKDAQQNVKKLEKLFPIC